MKTIIKKIKEFVVLVYITITTLSIIIINTVTDTINRFVNAFFNNPISVIITILQLFVPIVGILLSSVLWLVKTKTDYLQNIKLWISLESTSIFSYYLISHVIYSLFLIL